MVLVRLHQYIPYMKKQFVYNPTCALLKYLQPSWHCICALSKSLHKYGLSHKCGLISYTPVHSMHWRTIRYVLYWSNSTERTVRYVLYWPSSTEIERGGKSIMVVAQMDVSLALKVVQHRSHDCTFNNCKKKFKRWLGKEDIIEKQYTHRLCFKFPTKTLFHIFS